MTKTQQPSVLRQVTGATDFDERRKTARLDIPLKVEYVVKKDVMSEAAHDAKTKDVSVGGCLLLTNEELPIDSMVEIKLFLGTSETEALILQGRVVRLSNKNKTTYEHGIAFDEMCSEARRLFADFCFAKMYEMIGLTNWPTEKRNS